MKRYYDAASAAIEYLQANNRVANTNDEYQYKPSKKDLDILRRGVNIDNISHYKGEPIKKYKGVLTKDCDGEGESYLYKLYKNSLKG